MIHVYIVKALSQNDVFLLILKRRILPKKKNNHRKSNVIILLYIESILVNPLVNVFLVGHLLNNRRYFMLEEGDLEHMESIVRRVFPLNDCGSWNRIKKELAKIDIKKPKLPLLVERFTDNGAHSHYDLIDTETGKTLWSQQ
jgi:hypothetical protein